MSIDLDSLSDDEKEAHVVHYCATCLREIYDELYIVCIKCHGFTQCLECFSCGYENLSHLKIHPFVLMHPNTNCIFEVNWTLEEELIYLTAIQLCGFGNWSDISDNIRTKSPRQCEAHYDHVYLKSEKAPFPEFSLKTPAVLPPVHPYCKKIIESNPADNHPAILRENNKIEPTNPAEVCGYMPRRHEFEKEYNDEAENMICGLDFNSEKDTEKSFDTKLSYLVTYNDQIVERKMRTRVIEEWNLQYAPNLSLGSNTPTEREIDKKVLTFASYLGKEQTLSIVDTIRNYNRLCERLGRMVFWERNGVRSSYEGIIFQKLGSLIKSNHISAENVNDWNKGVKEYKKMFEINNSSEMQILSRKESKLCETNNIPPQLYFGLKDLILRECSIRESLTKEQAINIDPSYSKEISVMYDLFYSSGWIV